MRSKITMEMSICQAENGFSLDELVKKFADAFENKAFADILKMNLQLTQEVLMHQIFNGKSNQQCCSDGHLTMNGSFERRIRTSLGEFKMDFWWQDLFQIRILKINFVYEPNQFSGFPRGKTGSFGCQILHLLIKLLDF